MGKRPERIGFFMGLFFRDRQADVQIILEVKLSVHAAPPPARPTLLYDGDCNFCSFWVARWQRATGEGVDFLPAQERSVQARFPALDLKAELTSVLLVETDGAVYAGAEAVFRGLHHHPHGSWLMEWYAHSTSFARGSEFIYAFVARHRRFFSALTILGWGREVAPSSYALVSSWFLKFLALVYLVAFVSLGNQVIGLVGENGIVPAELTMNLVKGEAHQEHMGLDRYHIVPTFGWVDAGDESLKLQCRLGILFSVALFFGLAPAPCLFLLWLIYLSLATVCREFLSFQWDNLLLEAGFLSIFLAPLTWRAKWRRPAEPSAMARWILWWLLFRLMFQSGLVKLLSGDPTWRHLTALTYHYETQPLPTWVGWYAQQLPGWFQKFCCGAMFGIELAAPFFIFAPRRLRHCSGAFLAFLQLLILLTGNYCFFNWLTLALCFLLLDDAALRAVTSRRVPAFIFRRRGRNPASAQPVTQVPTSEAPRLELLTAADESGQASVQKQPQASSGWRWPTVVLVCVACLVGITSFVQFLEMGYSRLSWPRPFLMVQRWLSPFRTFNNYGLFAVMTTNRAEIVVEGSNDGVHWLEYGFRYKPGELKKRPEFVAPFQPRLDWQMWFAALDTPERNPWFFNFCYRLLQGRPEVLRLLGPNPFPRQPPKYIRALIYQYHFTDGATRRRTGAWWTRSHPRIYLQPIALQGTPGNG